jgi:DNA invertase Pin-like site-specific DNA recombinase
MHDFEGEVAISYRRFSDPTQGDGDSRGRQERGFVSFCERWELVPAPADEHMCDEGLSGYKGVHKDKGKLGVFLQLVRDGKIPRGRVLVVEALDRFSRMRPDLSMQMAGEILEAGVAIGVVSLGDIFTVKDLGGPKYHTLSTFFWLAHAESKQKQERVREAWKTKRDRARAGLVQLGRKADGRVGMSVTDRVPGWCRVENGKIGEVVERGEIVKRIFELAKTGYSHSKIAKTLTDGKVAAFGVSGRWTVPYVADILSDRRVLGEYCPTVDGVAGQPIKGYYPVVIEERLWLEARAAQRQRTAARGCRQRTHFNVFKGLAVCATDGEGFVLVNSNGTVKNPKLVLVNAASRERRAGFVSFPYWVLERAFLMLLREVSGDDVCGMEDVISVDGLREKVRELEEALAKDMEVYRKVRSETAALAADETRTELVAAQEAVAVAEVAAANPARRQWDEACGLMGLVERGEVELMRIRDVLGRVVNKVVLLILSNGAVRWCFMEVRFNSGEKRVFIVCACMPRFRPAVKKGGKVVKEAGGVDGWWWAMSGLLTAGWMDLFAKEEQVRARELVVAWVASPDEVTGSGEGWVWEVIPAKK